MADSARAGGSGSQSARGLRRPRNGNAGGGRGKEKKHASSVRQLDQIPASSYTDAEEALQAGIALEEKAERFAVGEKAKKYYLLSLDVYKRAVQLRQDDANPTYNAARVAFLLATTFVLPPQSTSALHEAIRLYNAALTLTPSHEQVQGQQDLYVPSSFSLDVEYNLGVALVALAEQADRVATSDVEPDSLLQQAIAHFENVLRGQDAVLRYQQQQERELESTSADVERPPLIASASNGDGENFQNADMDNADHQEEPADSDNVRSEFTSSLITPASALETIASLHAAAILLLDSCRDVARQKEIERQCSIYHAQAQSIFTAYPDGERRSPDNEWNEQVAGLRYAPLDLKLTSYTTALQNQEGHGFEGISELVQIGGEAQLESSTLLDTSASMTSEPVTNRSQWEVHVQQVERLADLMLNVGRVYLERIHAPSTTVDDRNTLVPQAWQLFAQSSKLFLVSSKALDVSASGQASVAVLGNARSSNPTTRRRCALFTSMSAVSVLRSYAIFVDVDAKTRRTLLDNARVYARKALAEQGLAWLLQPRAPGVPLTDRYHVPNGGLDSLVVDVEAVLALLRALSVRACEGVDEVVRSAALQETGILCQNLAAGMLDVRANQESAHVWGMCLGLVRDTSMPPGQAMLEQAIGLEGEAAISADQRAFWVHVEESIVM